MQVRYVGRSTTGIFIPAGAGEQHVEHGAVVDVPDDLGASLLTQEGQWEAVKSTPTKKADPAATPQEVQS